MVSVIFHPKVKYSSRPISLNLKGSNDDSYVRFDFISWRGKHIDGCNLFSITNDGFDSFPSIRESFGDVELDLLWHSRLKVIGVDMI